MDPSSDGRGGGGNERMRAMGWGEGELVEGGVLGYPVYGGGTEGEEGAGTEYTLMEGGNGVGVLQLTDLPPQTLLLTQGSLLVNLQHGNYVQDPVSQSLGPNDLEEVCIDPSLSLIPWSKGDVTGLSPEPRDHAQDLTSTVPAGKQETPILRCEICDDPFDTIALLRSHAKKCRHHKRYVCGKCGDSFNQATNFEVHAATHNSNAEDLTCPVCDKRFARYASFRCHVTTVHQVEDTAVCETCDEEFAFFTELKKHARIAHGEGGEVGTSQLYCMDCGLILADEQEASLHKANHRKLRETMRSVSVSKKRSAKKKRGAQHTCPHCSKVFGKRTALERHINIHTGAKPYVCSVCGKAFNQQGSLSLHQATHSQVKPFTCQLCGAGFTQKGNLRKHVLRLHPPDLSSERLAYSCPLCPCIFRSVQPLNLHVSRRHSDHIAGNESVLELHASLPVAVLATDDENCDSSINEPGGSQELGHSLRPTTNQTEKLKTVSRLEKNGKQLAVISQKLLKRATAELIKKNATTIMGDGLVGSGLVGGRVIEMDGKKFWECSTCSLRLSRCSDLVRHVRRHTGEKPYHCSFCQASFSLKSTLNRHLNSHMGLKIHRCHICTKLLSDPGSLRRHLALHATEPLSCTHCGKSFKGPSKLNYHLNKAHGPSDPKQSEKHLLLAEPLKEAEDGRLAPLRHSAPLENDTSRVHSCEQCGASYRHVRNLKFHITQAHSEGPTFFCTMCPRSFYSARYLKEHVERHGRRKHIPCSQCHKSFGTLQSLRRHSVVHSDKKPFLCPYCGRRFKRGTKCRVHIRTVHANRAVLPSTDIVAPYQEEATDPVEHMDVLPLPTEETLPQYSVVSNDTSCEDISSVIAEVLAPANLFEGDVGICDTRVGTDMMEFHEEAGEDVVGRDVWVSGRLEEVSEPPPHPANEFPTSAVQISSFPLIDMGPNLDGPQKQRTCPFCSKYFKKPSDYQRHLRIHTGEKPFECPTCGRSFRVKSTLTGHMKTHAEEYLSYVCQVCNKNFMSRSALKVHLRMHTNEKPFQCSICLEAFRTSNQRKRHWERTHGPRKRVEEKEQPSVPLVPKPSHIVSASKSTVLEGGSGSHLVIGTENSAFRPVRQARLSGGETGGGNLTGDEQQGQLCLSVLPAQSGKFQVEVRCIPRGSTSSSRDSDVLIEISTLKELVRLGMLLNIPFSAQDVHSECHVTVDPAHLLQSIQQQETGMESRPECLSMLEVSGPEPTPQDPCIPRDFFPICEVCELTFSTAEDSRKHFESEEHEAALQAHPVSPREERKWPCPTCNKVFTTRGKLARHSSVHAQEKPFACSLCQMRFSQSAGLRTHIRTQHSHAPPTFPCTFCPKHLSTRANLERHIERVHPRQPTDLAPDAPFEASFFTL